MFGTVNSQFLLYTWHSLCYSVLNDTIHYLIWKWCLYVVYLNSYTIYYYECNALIVQRSFNLTVFSLCNHSGVLYSSVFKALLCLTICFVVSSTLFSMRVVLYLFSHLCCLNTKYTICYSCAVMKTRLNNDYRQSMLGITSCLKISYIYLRSISGKCI